MLLHACREFITRDAGIEARVAGPLRRVLAVDVAEQLQRIRIGLGRHEVRLRGRAQVRDRRRARGVQNRALMQHGKEARREVPLLVVRQSSHVRQHHERRQILAEPAEPVREPRPHAREAGEDEPGVHHVTGRTVDVRLRRHRHEERHAIDLRGEVRKDAAHPAARLPVLFERERALHEVAGRAGDAFGLLGSTGVERLAVSFFQFGFEVEGVLLADAAVHEQLDDALDFGGVVQSAVEGGIGLECAGNLPGFGE